MAALALALPMKIAALLAAVYMWISYGQDSWFPSLYQRKQTTKTETEFHKLFFVSGTLFLIKELIKPRDVTIFGSAVSEMDKALNILLGLFLGIYSLFLTVWAYDKSVAPLLVIIAILFVLGFKSMVEFAKGIIFVFYFRVFKVNDVIEWGEDGKEYRVKDIHIQYTVLEEVVGTAEDGKKCLIILSNSNPTVAMHLQPSDLE